MPNRDIDALKLQLALELAPDGWRRGLSRFSIQIREGKLWCDAVASARAPRALKHLLLAVSHCPDPPEVLCHWLRAKRGNKKLTQAFKPLLYPTLLLLATFLVTSGMAWIGSTLMAGHEWIDWRTGRTDNLIARLFYSQWSRSLGAAALVGWLVLVGLIVFFFGAPLTRLCLAIDLPAFGKLIRWYMFRDLTQSLSVFMESGVNAEKAGQALLECYRGSSLEIPAAGIAKRIQAGQSMDRVVYNSILCDEFVGPAAMSLVRSQEKTSDRIQSLACLANQLFEQRAAALSQVANRIGLLFVLCMYMKLGMEVALSIQGITGSISELEFIGVSENWFILLPLAVVNFIFVNSMFHPKRGGLHSGITSIIKLFAAICLAMSLTGLTMRMTIADLIYILPLTLAVLALRANNRAMNRFAAASSLMLGANTPGIYEWIAVHLIDANRGQVRRRVKQFIRLIENGTSFGTALARSKLVTDHHERWLVALLTRFGNLPESQKILSTSSNWFESSTQLLQRINALKWMVSIFLFCTFFFVLFEVGLVWPSSRMFLTETNLPRMEILERFHTYFDAATDWFVSIEDVFYFSAYNQRLFLSAAIFPVLLTLLILTLPMVRRWFVDLWLSPIYRAWTLRGISEVLLSEHRLVQVLNETSAMHPIAIHRYRLNRLSRDIQAGLSVPNAFARSRMIQRSQRGLIEIANEPRQLAWALHQIATRNYFRWIEWHSMCLDILLLLFLLATATVVGLFGYVQFQLISYFISAQT